MIPHIATHSAPSLARLARPDDPKRIAQAEYVSCVMSITRQLRLVADYLEGHIELVDGPVKERYKKLRGFRNAIRRIHKMAGRDFDKVLLLQGGLMSPR